MIQEEECSNGPEVKDIEMYPNNWRGVIPNEFKVAAGGQGAIHLDIYYTLEFLEHLAFPSWVPLEELRVLDAACGTGEGIILLAIKYPGASFAAMDVSRDSLQQARSYAEELGLKNIVFYEGEQEERDTLRDYQIVILTRPLQYLPAALSVLQNLKKKLNPSGILVLRSDIPIADSELNQHHEELKAFCLESPLSREGLDYINMIMDNREKKYCKIWDINSLLADAGYRIQTGLHPKNYDPAQYINSLEAAELFGEKSWIEKACLAEILSGSMLRHSLVCTHADYVPAMPGIKDADTRTYIPFRSPYSTVTMEGDRAIIGQSRKYLLLNAEIEYDDINVPAKLFDVYLAIDGFRNFEQIHRRFLPMSWEVFWYFMEMLYETELIFLHR
jgi:SAM-dependent methyltransferase